MKSRQTDSFKKFNLNYSNLFIAILLNFLHPNLSLIYPHWIAFFWHLYTLVDYYFKFSFDLKVILVFAKDDFVHGAWVPLNDCYFNHYSAKLILACTFPNQKEELLGRSVSRRVKHCPPRKITTNMTAHANTDWSTKTQLTMAFFSLL